MLPVFSLTLPVKAWPNQHGVIPHLSADTSDSSLPPFPLKQIWLKSAPSTPQTNQRLRFLISLGFQSLDPFLYHLIPSTLECDKAPKLIPSCPCSPGSSLHVLRTGQGPAWHSELQSSRPKVRLCFSLESKGSIDLQAQALGAMSEWGCAGLRDRRGRETSIPWAPGGKGNSAEGISHSRSCSLLGHPCVCSSKAPGLCSAPGFDLLVVFACHTEQQEAWAAPCSS